MSEVLKPENGDSSILSIIRFLLPLYDNGDRKKERQKLKLYTQILRIVLKEPGVFIMKHLLEVGSCTVYELVSEYDVAYTTADRIMRLLHRGGVVKMVGFVGRPYWKGRGNQVKVFVLDGAHKSVGVEAQIRYGDLMKNGREMLVNYEDLDKSLELIKKHLDGLGIKRIPNKKLMVSMLREEGIKGVPITMIVNRLVKDGYKW